MEFKGSPGSRNGQALSWKLELSMGRKTHSDWVPEADQRASTEAALQELEADCKCRGAAADLFWGIEFRYLDALQHLDRVRDSDRNMLLFLQDLLSMVTGSPNEEQIANAIRFREERLSLSDNELRASIPKDLFPFLNRIHDLVRNIRGSPRELASLPKDKWESSAFVQLHLVTILLRAIRKGMWGSPELVDEFLEIGIAACDVIPSSDYEGYLFSEKRAFKAVRDAGYTVSYVSQDEVSTDILDETQLVVKQQKQSLSAVMGMFSNEAFAATVDKDASEVALFFFARAAALWKASTSGLSGELDLSKAARCFENLISSKSRVSSWEEVAESCNLICESLDEFPESDDLWLGLEILDGQGMSWRASDYWMHAATLAESEMSPPEFKEALDLKEKEGISKRIKLDFLEEDYELLEGDSRKALIEMEDTWHNAPARGGRREAAVNELRLVFEHEVDATVFGQIYESIGKILANRKAKDELHLKSRPGGKLNLRDMATILERAGDRQCLVALPVRMYIESLSLGGDDRDFLVSKLPEYLNKLAKTRAKLEHRDKVEKELSETIKSLRRTALGIGEPSYLRKLLNIKRIVRQKSHH